MHTLNDQIHIDLVNMNVFARKPLKLTDTIIVPA
jgi:hypothetical protein